MGLEMFIWTVSTKSTINVLECIAGVDYLIAHRRRDVDCSLRVRFIQFQAPHDDSVVQQGGLQDCSLSLEKTGWIKSGAWEWRVFSLKGGFWNTDEIRLSVMRSLRFWFSTYSTKWRFQGSRQDLAKKTRNT